MSDELRSTRPAATAADLFHGRVMLVLFTLAIAGTCWLISAGHGTDPGEEVHLPWKPGSVLHFLTTLMTLDFQYPTRAGVEVKWLVQGIAASIAIWIAGASWCARLKALPELLEAAPSRRVRPAHIAATAFLLLAAWSMLSAVWAPWPAAAWGEGVRYALFVLWAVAIAASLKQAQVRQAAMAMVIVLTLTAALGIWYFYQRDPTQRLKFPIGNPIFLGTCLLPGIALALAGAWHALARMAEPAEAVDEPDARFRPPWLVAIVCVAAIIVLSTALKLTGSRGPQLGLIIGVAAAVIAMLRGRSRQKALIALLVLLILGTLYVQMRGYPGLITRRMDTVMLRVYAWSYALHLFAEHPLIGQGQAGYVLLSQHLSMPDAQFNPIIFPGGMMGHAHNEWLEVLSDLGIVGFLLVVVGLTATFWSGVRALHHAVHSGDRFLALGLLAAFTAIVAAEATDVGLRIPGVPMIFYSVIGCLWALDPREGSANQPSRILSSPPGRAMIWTAATALSIALLLLSIRDWQGALVERSALTSIDRHQWPQALQQADYAARHRLSVEARLAAELDYTAAAHAAAVYRFHQLRGMIERQQNNPKPDANILDIASEDAAFVTQSVQACMDRGSALLARIPDYPGVASRMGEALLVMQDTQTLIARLGLTQEPRDYAAAARGLIHQEYERNPLDPGIALRLLQLSTQEPIEARLSLLLPPLRVGPVSLKQPVDKTDLSQEPMAIDLFGEFELALASLVNEPGFDEAVGQLLNTAQEALSGMDAERCLREYVPEALRLAARVHKLKGEFASAAQLAQVAANVSVTITGHFPEAVSNALVDLAGYTLLAEPENPGKAVIAGQEAVTQNGGPYAARRVARLKRYVAYLQLATGDEAAARQTLSETLTSQVPALLDGMIGRGLFEVCRNGIEAWPIAQRPAWFQDRMQRLVQLMPEMPGTLLLQTTVAMEQGNDADATVYLEHLVKAANNPAAVTQTLQYLTRKFPDNQNLQAFIQQLEAAATQPASDTAEALGSRQDG